MTSPEGRWTMKDTQGGSPDRYIEISRGSDRFTYEIYTNPNGTGLIESGFLLRRPHTDRFLMIATDGGETGILEFDAGADLWLWQQTTGGSAGGHLEEGWTSSGSGEEDGDDRGGSTAAA